MTGFDKRMEPVLQSYIIYLLLRQAEYVFCPCESTMYSKVSLVFVGGQTGAAVVMVAERAAEILLRGSADAAQVKEPELALA